MKFSKACICSIGYALPEMVVTSLELEQHLSRCTIACIWSKVALN